MPRRTSYFGGWIAHSVGIRIGRSACSTAEPHSGAKKRCMKVSKSGSHPTIRGDLLHFPYRSWSDQLQRIDRYTRIASEAAKAAGRRGNPVMLVLAPPISFLLALCSASFSRRLARALIAYSAAAMFSCALPYTALTMELVVCLLFGLAIGSFLNVCIARIRQANPLFIHLALSKVPEPNSRIRQYSRIQYLLLHGRCRKCREPISAASGIEFMTDRQLLLYFQFGLTLEWECFLFFPRR